MWMFVRPSTSVTLGRLPHLPCERRMGTPHPPGEDGPNEVPRGCLDVPSGPVIHGVLGGDPTWPPGCGLGDRPLRPSAELLTSIKPIAGPWPGSRGKARASSVLPGAATTGAPTGGTLQFHLPASRHGRFEPRWEVTERGGGRRFSQLGPNSWTQLLRPPLPRLPP